MPKSGGAGSSGPGGNSGGKKEHEDYEDHFLHSTIGGNRIQSHSNRHGTHKLTRHYTPSSTASALSTSSVSSYLQTLPAIHAGDNSMQPTSSVLPPPRPARPPGGLLGISNGHGIGYTRTLGASYDGPLTIHDSFNGHVRSGANLYGGRNSSSGLLPSRSGGNGPQPHRPSMSVFPIQKALEIAIKESRLLSVASHRGEGGSATATVREILDSYPAPSPYCVDEKNRSPLHFAAAAGDLELVEFLLERGVRPDCGRDVAGNMPLHLAIISNRIDVVGALLKAGADMTLASPMTHKTPLDLAESRLTFLLNRAQEMTQMVNSHNNNNNNNDKQLLTRSSAILSTQGTGLLQQIKGIVDLLRPYVVRQQRIQLLSRQKERQQERSWDRADKYMRQQGSTEWRVEKMQGDDDEDDMDEDGDVDLDKDDPSTKMPIRKAPMDANETELALENLMNGLSLLEAGQKNNSNNSNANGGMMEHGEQRVLNDPQSTLLSSSSDLQQAISVPIPKPSTKELDDALPDLLQQVQDVLQSIKLHEEESRT